MRLRRVVQRLTGGGTPRPPSPIPFSGPRSPLRAIASPAVLDFTRNHFELFGLPARYAIDANALESAYRELQRTVHPDRHAASDDDAARRLALQAAARVNEAYRTLADPVERARYLLALEGVEAFDAADTSLPVDFLERQLERRERGCHGVDLDLHRCGVGEGVDGQAAKGNQPRDHQPEGGQQHQRPVPQGQLDDPIEHRHSPSEHPSPMLSFSVSVMSKKAPVVTTASPAINAL